MTDIAQRPLELTQAELDRATERIDDLQQKLSLYENLTAEYGLSIFEDISDAVAAAREACAKVCEDKAKEWVLAYDEGRELRGYEDKALLGAAAYIRARAIQWDEDRIDIIGQNGNDGLAYQEK